MVLDHVLYLVREVAEEVDTRQFFQLVDADGVILELCVGDAAGVLLMFHPEANGIVASLCLQGVLLTKQSHEKVIGHDKLLTSALCPGMVALVDGTPLHDIERVAERIIIICIAKTILQVVPDAVAVFVILSAIEARELRLHVAQVERLAIGLYGHLPIGTAHDMAPVVSVGRVVVQGCPVLPWNQRVFTPSLGTARVAPRVFPIPSESRPTLCA